MPAAPPCDDFDPVMRAVEHAGIFQDWLRSTVLDILDSAGIISGGARALADRDALLARSLDGRMPLSSARGCRD
eukprot:4724424-Pyramimonas_sp.AAC.1